MKMRQVVASVMIIMAASFSMDATVVTPPKSMLDTLTPDARRSMEWLYSYMPLPDVTAYSPEFYLSNVLFSLKAREEMPWGKNVPDREFRHFVLPVRVNNENLDMSRAVFYRELKDRVKGLSMRDAILEINHWCHEKVTYQPSDARTSSPLSSVSQAIGRCGEESTFTVAALRAMGIPARQVYTPRWAHTDDNHAWVEAWADGKWYFLGACEPAPDLNIAWFNAPASRGLLMTTKVFGPYDGPEEVLKVEPLLTTINVTSNYAPTGILKVRVTDKDGKKAEGVKVNFCIYNYSDFYPAVQKISDSKGEASLVAGLGDLIVWATDGKYFGFDKGNPAQEGVLEIKLDKPLNYTGSFEFDIVPPRQSGSLPVATEAAEKENVRRLAVEDSIRKAYTSTFFTSDKARKEARRLGVDEEKFEKILTEARGNGSSILGFVERCEPAKRGRALDLLGAISEKDRRDITLDVLIDNVDNTVDSDNPLFVDYILNPRVENEWLVPYKAFFSAEISPEDAKAYRNNPSKLAEWTAQNIKIDTEGNPSSLRMDPRAVWRTASADPRSRNIFFVSVARSVGIPARIDPVTFKTQYADASGKWMDVKFDANEDSGNVAAPHNGKLMLKYKQEGRLENPKYYFQFAVSSLAEGVPVLLEYGEGDGLKEIASEGVDLDEGNYLLLSGRRMADGSVLARGEIFRINEGEETDVPLIIRKDDNALSVIGSLNAENIYHDKKTGTDRSLLSETGRGYYVLALIKPNNEPTSHILNDISMLKDEFEKRGNKLMLLFENEGEMARFNADAFPNLPSSAVFGIDNDGVSLKELKASLNLETDERPIVVVADTFNRVVFATQGYTIGIGDRLADVLDILSK
jgi:hypothetical protein